jgi:hypothetical protein
MLKKLFAVCLGFLPLLGKAQVTLNAQLPPAGFVQKDQLWNLIVVNNNADILDISIQLNLQDGATGQVVLTANTGNIVAGKGVKNITVRDVQPVLYNYAAPDFSKKYLPMGSYVACYQLINNANRKTLMAEECIRINIDPLSPPMLNSPSDKSEIQSLYPQFTWMPPTPFDMFTSLSYDLLVTEVLEGQSATEAIQYNTPIYTKDNINQPYESYASSFTKLDTGKIYAWQVIAKNGLNYAAKTEVWTFKIKSNNLLKPAVNDTYILLDDKAIGTYLVKSDVLHVKYYSFNAAYQAQLTYSDEQGNMIKQVTQKIIQGDNYFDLSLATGFQQNKVYKLSITDSENKMHTLTFSINKK